MHYPYGHTEDHCNYCRVCGCKIFTVVNICPVCVAAEKAQNVEDPELEAKKIEWVEKQPPMIEELDERDAEDTDDAYIPTQEEIDSMTLDMNDPALFGELAIPPDLEEFPIRRQEDPEDFEVL